LQAFCARVSLKQHEVELAQRGAGRTKEASADVMKILLQNLRTKLYFNLLGVWTDDPELAYDFRHSGRAVDYAHLNGLTDVQLVLNFSDPAWANVAPAPVPVATLSPRNRF
jgi:hypothetical protein